MTVAIVSANLSIIELLKSLTKRLESWQKRRQALLKTKVIQEECCTQGRGKGYPDSFDKKNALFIRIGKTAVALGYVASVYFMITTPFKAIPDTERTNTVIGAVSLFTFALLFISMIINEAADWDEQEYEAGISRLLLSHRESMTAPERNDTVAETVGEEK